MKKLAIGLALSLVCCSFEASAADVCANLPGAWVGHGKVIFDSKSFGKNIQCVYDGVAHVTSSDSDAHVFSSEISLSLLSGVCPQTVNVTLPGTCDNGHISMTAADGSADLAGQLGRNGKVGTLSGDIAFELNGESILGHLDKTILVKSK